MYSGGPNFSAMVASGGATYPLVEVYTGEHVVDLPQSTPADVERAAATVRAAQKEWAARPLADRLAVMKRFHARGRGRASTVEKWFSHLKIVVAEQQLAATAEQEAA